MYNRAVEVRIRHLTDELHRLLKIRAAQDSMTLNDLILKALEDYIRPTSRKK